MQQNPRTLSTDMQRLGRGIAGLVDSLTLAPTHGHTIVVFQKALYLWVLAYTMLLLPAGAQFWGPNAYTMPQPTSGWVDRFLSLLNEPAIAPYWGWFVAGQILFAVLGLWGRCPRLAALGLLFFVKNLNHKAWMIGNGGINFLDILLLLNLFMHPVISTKPGAWSMSNNVLANMAFYAARIQLCIIYAVSGLAKVTGKLWAHGVGVYYVLNADEFTTPLGRWLSTWDALVIVGSFGTIAFMLTFSTLVWFRKTRPWILLVGIGLHSQIALIMGLVDFGTIMMLSYLLFLPDSLSQKILDVLNPKPIVVTFRHGAGLMGWLVALGDWRGLVNLVEDGTPSETPALTGAAAVRAIVARIPLTMPLLPLLAALEYLGLSERLLGKWSDGVVSRVAIEG